MKTNYQLLLDNIINNIPANTVPTLLLHSCCGPCSSYVLEYLSKYFKITIFYYNPNIDTNDEFNKRLNEQKRLISEMSFKYPVDIIVGDYESDRWYEEIRGMEEDLEGGNRCHKCYEMRLRESALLAKEKQYDYFTTTLSISPYKNAQVLNEIGKNLETELNIKYLYADFKKKEGYKRSIELSRQYQLYRQDYCGCLYSKIHSKSE